MDLGLSYIVGGTILTILLAMLRIPSDEFHPSDVSFRYNRTSMRVLLLVVPTFSLFLYFIWRGMALSLRDNQAAVIFACGWLALFMLVASYVYCNAYTIIASKDGLHVNGVAKNLFISYRDIKEVTLKQGSPRDGDLLSIYNQQGKRVLSVSSSFDYRQLSALIHIRAAEFGVVYKTRDMWGKWT